MQRTYRFKDEPKFGDSKTLERVGKAAKYSIEHYPEISKKFYKKAAWEMEKPKERIYDKFVDKYFTEMSMESVHVPGPMKNVSIKYKQGRKKSVYDEYEFADDVVRQAAKDVISHPSWHPTHQKAAKILQNAKSAGSKIGGLLGKVRMSDQVGSGMDEVMNYLIALAEDKEGIYTSADSQRNSQIKRTAGLFVGGLPGYVGTTAYQAGRASESPVKRERAAGSEVLSQMGKGGLIGTAGGGLVGTGIGALAGRTGLGAAAGGVIGGLYGATAGAIHGGQEARRKHKTSI